jgi:hypothetical protein
MQMRAGVTSSLLLQGGLIFFLTLFMFACKPKDQAELYGTYIADYDVAKEKIILNKDGTFIQEVTLKATFKIDVAKGRWSYDPTNGYVMFHENFMAVLNGFRKLNPDYNHPNTGIAFLPADKYFGCILLGVAEGVLYKKVN